MLAPYFPREMAPFKGDFMAPFERAMAPFKNELMPFVGAANLPHINYRHPFGTIRNDRWHTRVHLGQMHPEDLKCEVLEDGHLKVSGICETSGHGFRRKQEISYTVTIPKECRPETIRLTYDEKHHSLIVDAECPHQPAVRELKIEFKPQITHTK